MSAACELLLVLAVYVMGLQVGKSTCTNGGVSGVMQDLHKGG